MPSTVLFAHDVASSSDNTDVFAAMSTTMIMDMSECFFVILWLLGSFGTLSMWSVFASHIRPTLLRSLVI